MPTLTPSRPARSSTVSNSLIAAAVIIVVVVFLAIRCEGPSAQPDAGTGPSTGASASPRPRNVTIQFQVRIAKRRNAVNGFWDTPGVGGFAETWVGQKPTLPHHFTNEYAWPQGPGDDEVDQIYEVYWFINRAATPGDHLQIRADFSGLAKLQPFPKVECKILVQEDSIVYREIGSGKITRPDQQVCLAKAIAPVR